MHTFTGSLSGSVRGHGGQVPAMATCGCLTIGNTAQEPAAVHEGIADIGFIGRSAQPGSGTPASG
jgi:hypothetical protein